MKNKIVVSFFLLFSLMALVLYAPASVSACDKGDFGKYGKGKTCCLSAASLIGKKLLPCSCFLLQQKDALKLTKKQITALKLLKLRAKKAKINAFAQVKIMKLDLRHSLDSNRVNLREVDRYVDNISKTLGRNAKQCIRSRLEARSILTDSQRDLATTLAKVTCKKQAGTVPAKHQQACKKQGFSQQGKKACASKNKAENSQSLFLQVSDLY